MIVTPLVMMSASGVVSQNPPPLTLTRSWLRKEIDMPEMVIDREALLKMVNDYLRSLPSDESRKDFLLDIDSVCHLCGSTILPCYCASSYDE